MIKKSDLPWLLFWVSLITVAFVYDAEIFSFVQGLKTPVLTWIFTGATFFGDFAIGLIVTMVAVFFLIDKKTYKDSLISLLINLGIVFIFKNTIVKQRPNLEFQSFPSGHSSSMLAIFHPIEKVYKKNYFYIFAAIICISRIYLGMHFPSDVAVGAFIGVLVSEFVVRFKLAKNLEKFINK